MVLMRKEEERRIVQRTIKEKAIKTHRHNLKPGVETLFKSTWPEMPSIPQSIGKNEHSGSKRMGPKPK